MTRCWRREGDNGGAGAQGRTRTLHGELADARRPRWRISGSLAGTGSRAHIDGEVSRRIKCLQVLITLVFFKYTDGVHAGAGAVGSVRSHVPPPPPEVSGAGALEYGRQLIKGPTRQ